MYYVHHVYVCNTTSMYYISTGYYKNIHVYVIDVTIVSKHVVKKLAFDLDGAYSFSIYSVAFN